MKTANQQDIKGHQVQKLKNGNILLVFHRALGAKPESLTGDEWKDWLNKTDWHYRLEESPYWWDFCWPDVRRAINTLLLAKQSEAVVNGSRAWIRIGDDIAVSIYKAGPNNTVHSMYKHGPFNPRYLSSYARISLQYWHDKYIEIDREIYELMKGEDLE